MKLVQKLVIVFTVTISSMCGSNQNPNLAKSSDFDTLRLRNPITVLGWLNIFATFEPSRTSRGHRGYFGNIDELTFEEGKKMLAFAKHIEGLRTAVFVLDFFGIWIQGAKPSVVIPLSAVFLNGFYLFELRNFEDRVVQKIKELEKAPAQ